MKKKNILICINELYSNSIGNSLINLLYRVDYTLYNIDLIFTKSQTQIISLIPKNINIIDSPFDTSKIKFMYKLKFFHKYDMSIMYDVGDPKLVDLVIFSSKNNYLYFHKNYREIYVVQNRYEQFVEEHKLLKFRNYLFSNKQLQENFLKLYPQYHDVSTTLPYIIDDKHIITLSKANVSVEKPNHCTLLVSVGSINDRAKNYTLMIKMMNNLVKLNNHVHLWIIGDGPDLVNLRMLVTKYNLSNYITLFGFKSNPYPYMSLGDYYLNTSDTFDSSTSLLEARVLQKPIISTNVDLQNNNTYIVSPDPNKIASEINEIILKKVKYNGVNNFWEENQQILKKFETLFK